MSEIKNKVIWITGASSGIGEALAYQIAEKGGKLILSARRENELQRVKDNCKGINPDEIKILPLDLNQPDTLPILAQEAISLFGTVDILINNGGVTQRSLAVETSSEVERIIMEVNFFAAITLSKSVLTVMKKQQSGHLVIISSVAGKVATKMRSSYAASKHALQGYFDSLRAEVWQDNIKVTLICPGYVKTSISLNAFTAEGAKYNQMDKNQELGISVDVCAQKILQAIEKDQEEIYIARKEMIAVYLKRFFPGILSKIVKNIKVGN
ncbi:SDR family oxidoreductase [Gloeothece verrucosa]|uniref:Short-chain dehydrogenase/reductase SDR n=1 Tax=Gloeothece verrucosa (strain PCC 7822) TaxID=497965 RepID=E0UFG5_GLOV7|nr:SDR family oxidoreductase [Gloeothece verrucosa]ADN16659.1 short-chain dehydrogenase/reductase SDR [Gloeothece verrucosa PCC 7822]